MLAAVVSAGCSEKHPHTQFDGFLVLPPSTDLPCEGLPGVGAASSWADDKGRAFSLEMRENATDAEVSQVRRCLRNGVQEFTEKRVDYELPRIDR